MQKTGFIEYIENSGSGDNAKGHWERWVFTIEGKKYSTFDPEIYENEFLEVGTDVIYELEKKGNFWNLKSMKPKMPYNKVPCNESAHAPIVRPGASNAQNSPKPQATSPKSQEYHLSPEESRARALECAIAYYQMAGIKGLTDQVTSTASLFLKFILGEK